MPSQRLRLRLTTATMATVPDPTVDTVDTSAEASIGAKFSQSEVQTEAQNEL